MTENIAVLILLSMLGGALLVVSFIVLQIHNRNLLLRKNQELHDAALHHQKNILYATITSQEQERERIGMDLHDDVGAQLSWLRLLLEQNAGESDRHETGQPLLAQRKGVIDTIIQNVRAIAHDLSPRIKDLPSLLDSLHDTADQLNQSGSIAMTFDTNGYDSAIRLDAAAALNLYRIVAELVNNTLKHAAASRIELSLTDAPGGLRVCYSDDGTGLPAAAPLQPRGRGLQNIENRIQMLGAHADWGGSPKGFAIQITVPGTSLA